MLQTFLGQHWVDLEKRWETMEHSIISSNNCFEPNIKGGKCQLCMLLQISKIVSISTLHLKNISIVCRFREKIKFNMTGAKIEFMAYLISTWSIN